MTALLQTDSYKIGHVKQYPKNTQLIYSNFTARSGKHSGIIGNKGVIFVGLQHFVQEFLIEEWNNTFFNQPKDEVCQYYKEFLTEFLCSEIDITHVEKLHDLGYLPLEIKALPEGSFVPYKVPVLTVKNTIDEFYWLTNYIETVLSCELWLPITSATTMFNFLKNSYVFSEMTCDDDSHVKFQNHDFSFRGMQGRHAAAISGFAALVAGSVGTDTLPAVQLAKRYYKNDDSSIIGCSVPASEHSCMTIGKTEGEFEVIKRLITEVYPTGIVSIVSDSYDFWNVIGVYLMDLKDIIMNREGKVVIRPDSGDPVDIICGKTILKFELHSDAEDHFRFNTNGDCLYQVDNQTYKVIKHLGNDFKYEKYELSLEEKGLIESLWGIFGGHINSKGYKVLDSHIGAIYGDSITLKRQREILEKLEQKGFASSNIVFGVGSYTFGFQTRDSHGMAMKSTAAKINGETVEIFKDPKTDDGTKKSAKGFLYVEQVGRDFNLIDKVTERIANKAVALQPVFLNGKLVRYQSLTDIRNIVKSFM